MSEEKPTDEKTAKNHDALLGSGAYSAMLGGKSSNYINGLIRKNKERATERGI